MNPRDVIAVSGRSAVTGSPINNNEADSSSSKTAPPGEPPAAAGGLNRAESDTPGKWLKIEHPASDPGHPISGANQEVPKDTARGGASTNVMVAVVKEGPKDLWPLTLDEIIKQTLVRLLSETGGNRRRTASVLGISRSTLYRMIARYGLDHVGRSALSPRSIIGPPV
jgi:hypothetical protein